MAKPLKLPAARKATIRSYPDDMLAERIAERTAKVGLLSDYGAAELAYMREIRNLRDGGAK